MNLFEKIVNIIAITGKTPTSYGIFHFISVAVVLLVCILLCKKYKDCNDKTIRIICLISWITMLLLEIYKQVVFSFKYNNGDRYWDYQWYAFPYQLCSTPLYVLPFIVFLKNGKVRDSLIAFMATFSLFGGLAVYAFPNDVFINIIGINFQTMIHHGLQVILGIFLLVHNRNRLDKVFFIKACCVFLVLLASAVLLNEVVYASLKANGNSESFNMFYISQYFDCTLPLLNIIYKEVPYFVFFLIYCLGFILIGFIILFVASRIVKLVNNRGNYENKK